jgi:hypothetical protein
MTQNLTDCQGGKRKKWHFWLVMIVVLLLLSSTGYGFYNFFLVIIPPKSVVKIWELDYSGKVAKIFFAENATAKTKYKIVFHEEIKLYTASRQFVIKGIETRAPKRQEQRLKNDVCFSVLFPYQEISASDTVFVFFIIDQVARTSLYQASLEIDQNFYAASGIPYPQLFKNYLNETAEQLDLYFTDVTISHIDYL